MRQVAGDRQQLQLEGQSERVELGIGGALERPVEHVQEAGQARERARMRLGLDEQLQHRLGSDQPDRQRVPVGPHRLVGVDDVGARDGVQLAAALVQHQRGDGSAAPAARRTARRSCARPWRSRSRAPARACTGAARGRPPRSGSSAAPRRRSCSFGPCRFSLGGRQPRSAACRARRRRASPPAGRRSRTSNTALGVPAAHQTVWNRRSELSTTVCSGRSWPSGGTPPMA